TGPDEMQKVAERPAPDDVLQHRVDDAVDLDFVEAEGRLAVTTGHPLEHFGTGRNVPAEGRGRQGVPRIAEHEVGRVRNRTRRSERRMSHFVNLIGITP